MKTFSFLCKHGQEERVALILQLHTKRSPTVQRRPDGVLVSLELLPNESKRKLDRLLFNENIPGARSRKNKVRVFNEDIDKNDIFHEIGCNVPFWRTIKGKFYKRVLVEYGGCDCCGHWVEEELVPR